MNNTWLGFLIAKVQVVVPSMEDVAYLRRKKVKIYGLKKHPDGYLVTVRKGTQNYLGEDYPIVKNISIYPALLRFSLPSIAVIVLMISMMNRYSIGYEITGNLNPEETAQLEKLIGENFFVFGPFEFLLTDIQQIDEQIRAFYDEYIYVDINREGNTVRINVFQVQNVQQERSGPPKDAFYARLSGQIERVDLKTCRSLVIPGQMVKSGERLAACTVIDVYNNNIERPSGHHIEGEIWARTWYVTDVTFPKSFIENMMTTRVQTRRIFNAGSLSWQFPNAEVEFADFVTKSRRIDPFFFLENSPLFLETIHYYEKSDIMKVNDVEEIKQNAFSLIKNEFGRQFDTEFELIEIYLLETRESEEDVTLLFHVTIIENIAQ